MTRLIGMTCGRLFAGATAENAPAHGVINFVIEANHVRFDIDADAATRNHLVISSKLMQLAHKVKSRGGD